VVYRLYESPKNVAHHPARQVTVENVNTGDIIQDEADVVISARGTLNNKAWPNIPGLEDMKIPVMHSAAWDDRQEKSLFYHYYLADFPLVSISKTRE
jgi:hypothetical protein